MDFTRFNFLIYDTAKTPNEFSNITIEMTLKGLLHQKANVKNGEWGYTQKGRINRISHNFLIFNGIYMILIQLVHFLSSHQDSEISNTTRWMKTIYLHKS